METQQSQSQQWYDNKVLLIILFFLFPPLGIYGILKHKTDTWKKVLYIIPSTFIILFFVIGIIGSFFMDSYKTGLDYYNKKDYVKAYEFLQMVKPDDKNYNDAIAKISEIKPIVDSINLAKENEKLTKKQNREIEKAEKESHKEISDTPLLEFPANQQNFLKVIDEYRAKYDDAPNELKKSAVRTERGNKIKEALGSTHNFSNWVGVVKQMQTTSKGKAIFTIEIEGTGIKMGTINNEFSDLFDNTLIEQSNPLFNVIAELEKGDKVIVSGSFLNSNGSDYVEEYSMTEAGSMKTPDFLVRFTNVQNK